MADDLSDDARQHSRSIIESELRRLASRAPALGRREVDIVDAALDDLVESLYLARLRTVSHDAARLRLLLGI